MSLSNPGQHILVEDGHGGRDGLAGVVVEGEVVGIYCLHLKPAIGKIKKIENNVYKKITLGCPCTLHIHISSMVYVNCPQHHQPASWQLWRGRTPMRRLS
jgi:hypothetical protein